MNEPDNDAVLLGYTPDVLNDYMKSGDGLGWDPYFGVRLEKPYRKVLIGRLEYERLKDLFERLLGQALRSNDTYTFECYCDCHCVISVQRLSKKNKKKRIELCDGEFYAECGDEFKAALTLMLSKAEAEFA